ncbi:MAG: hypothetical protein Q7R79_03535 [bacterium]|nr:hypothetical protein [bacterium]
MSVTPDQRERDDRFLGQEISASSEGASGLDAEALLNLTILDAIRGQDPAPIDTFLSHLSPDRRAYLFSTVSPEKGSPSRFRAASMRVWRMRAEHAKLRDFSAQPEDIDDAHSWGESSVIYRRSPAPVERRPEGFGERTLSREDVEDVRVFGAFGSSPLALALWMGVGESSIRRLIREPYKNPLDISWMSDPLEQESAAKILDNQSGEGGFRKANLRKQYLNKNPERKRAVNPIPLRQILPYLAFTCHPGCSIARGQAIEGSDIDRGLVLLPPGIHHAKREMAFIRELRGQGFSVYHETEWQKVREQLNNISTAEAVAQGVLTRDVETRIKMVHFVSLDRLCELRGNAPEDMDILIALAGYNIDPERTLGASIP